jgi:hypothetical protein
LSRIMNQFAVNSVVSSYRLSRRARKGDRESIAMIVNQKELETETRDGEKGDEQPCAKWHHEAWWMGELGYGAEVYEECEV